jgi:hypothetical protein
MRHRKNLSVFQNISQRSEETTINILNTEEYYIKTEGVADVLWPLQCVNPETKPTEVSWNAYRMAPGF